MLHGIGVQRKGATLQEVVQAFREGSNGAIALKTMEPGPKEFHAAKAETPAAELYVCEGHWADLSHPDNPPAIHGVGNIIREYLSNWFFFWCVGSGKARR